MHYPNVSMATNILRCRRLGYTTTDLGGGYYSPPQKHTAAIFRVFRFFPEDEAKVKKGKVHPCTGTETLYRPYGPQGK
jgi:hypothetical protein